MLIAAIVLALVAADPDAGAGTGQDAVVATAPTVAVSPAALARADAEAAEQAAATQEAVAHGLTTDQQIDRWIMSRSSADISHYAEPAPVDDDRRIHGMVSAGIGTGGYRDYGVSMSVPVGETGRMDLHYSRTENAPWGYGYRGGYRDLGPYRHSDPQAIRMMPSADDER